jgi:hypothetical protein
MRSRIKAEKGEGKREKTNYLGNKRKQFTKRAYSGQISPADLFIPLHTYYQGIKKHRGNTLFFA